MNKGIINKIIVELTCNIENEEIDGISAASNKLTSDALDAVCLEIKSESKCCRTDLLMSITEKTVIKTEPM